MSSRNRKSSKPVVNDIPASPLKRAEWVQILEAMRLSPRQADIVDLILRGCGDKKIASTLGMSFSTVRTHLRQIFARQNVDDRVELILRVFAIVRKKSRS